MVTVPGVKQIAPQRYKPAHQRVSLCVRVRTGIAALVAEFGYRGSLSYRAVYVFLRRWRVLVDARLVRRLGVRFGSVGDIDNNIR